MRTITPPGRGRRPAIFQYNITKQLDETDIAEMWAQKTTQGVPALKALRYNHHLLAKAVASGKSLLECTQLTGLTGPRISVLKNDPAFQELVSFYAEELNEVYVDVHQRMAALGTSVLEELQERFEESPDKFTKRELMELFTTMADRSIATAKGGPKAQQAIVPGPNGGLALQINFVSPQGETIEQTLTPLPQTQAPAARALANSLDANSLRLSPLETFYPEGFEIDGEPTGPDALPIFSPAEAAQAKFDAMGKQIEDRERAARERDALREQYMADRRKGI